MRDLKSDIELWRSKNLADNYEYRKIAITNYKEACERAIAAEALLARIGGDKTITGLAKSNIDLLDDNQILRKQKATAEAALQEKTAECNTLRIALIDITKQLNKAEGKE